MTTRRQPHRGVAGAIVLALLFTLSPSGHAFAQESPEAPPPAPPALDLALSPIPEAIPAEPVFVPTCHDLHPSGLPADNRLLASCLAPEFGWDEGQFVCFDRLMTKESGWVTTRKNRAGSSAYGIPQALPGRKMASHGADWAVNPQVQIRWAESYIRGRYGTPCAALAHSNRRNWY